MVARCVPLIDMEDDNVGEKMVKALEEWGCFRLVNHGVAAELMAEMKAVARAFTDLPLEMKMTTVNPHYPSKGYTQPKLGGPGYEGLNLDDVALPGTIDRFCSQLHASPHQKEVLEKYASTLHDLAQLIGRKIVEGMAIGMEGEIFKNWACQLKLNKYNHGPETVGLTSGIMHTDPGFLTLLQDDEIVNGLEIIDNITGQLVPLDPIPGSLLINLGDMAEVWSNGRFHVPKHQVRCHAPIIRTSVAYFALAPRDEKMETPPEMVDSGHPRRYAPFDFEDYRMARSSTRSATGEALQYFLTKTL